MIENVVSTKSKIIVYGRIGIENVDDTLIVINGIMQ